jgi:hypothetical protein
MRIALISLLFASFGTAAASAAPLSNQANSVALTSVVENVKIVCRADGYCSRILGRPKVAHWVYGDDAFYGPYVGPGNYGRPGWHSGWGWWW